MSVVNTETKNVLSCNSSAVDFDFTFGVMDEDEIKVTYTTSGGVATVLDIDTEYTVSAVNDDFSEGGTVTTIATYPTGSTITIEMNIPYTQERSFTEGMPTLYKSFERGLDKLTRLAQQLKALIGTGGTGGGTTSLSVSSFVMEASTDPATLTEGELQFDGSMFHFTADEVRGRQDIPLFSYTQVVNHVQRLAHSFVNFIGNSGFESWSAGDDTYPDLWFTAGGDALCHKEANPSQGSYALQLTLNSVTPDVSSGVAASWGNLNQYVPYTLTFWYQKISGAGKAALIAQMGETPYTEFASYTLDDTIDGTWRLASVSFYTLPAWNGKNSFIKIGARDIGTSVWLIDEVMVQEGAYMATSWLPAFVNDQSDEQKIFGRKYFYEAMKGMGGIQIGGASNYANISNAGEITLVGTARVNKIINLGISGLGVGSVAPTAIRLGDFYGYSFTKGDDGYIGAFEIPYDWDPSTNIIVKIHWYISEAYATHSGKVRWNILYTPRAEVGEAVDAGSQTLDFGDVNIPATAKHLVETTAVIVAARLAVDDVIGMVLTTVALVAGTDPTAEPVCVGVEIEYVSNKLGE